MGQNSFWISIAPSFVQTVQHLEQRSISMSATVLVPVQTRWHPMWKTYFHTKNTVTELLINRVCQLTLILVITTYWIGEWHSLWIIQLGPDETQEWVTSVTKKEKKNLLKSVRGWGLSSPLHLDSDGPVLSKAWRLEKADTNKKCIQEKGQGRARAHRSHNGVENSYEVSARWYSKPF